MMNREMNENMVEQVNGGYLVDNGDGTYTVLANIRGILKFSAMNNSLDW